MRQQEKLPASQEFVGETHRVLECTQNHPPWNKNQKGPLCLWVEEEVTENRQGVEQRVLFPLGPLPHIQHHNAVEWLPCPGEHLRLYPLLHNRCMETNMAEKNYN